ncbi:methyl-accepting chemotaxis protein [Pseudoglutamicibacter albus]|uniref:Methyl-accepting chemotaxis protein n=1 Tax=Pseudoglutamicibacter albus TaxID=98671 RepID=A0ABU1YYC2_9MICC|nr:hypothetical protein [Pseudoglutamicibacter albus]MDR7293362.1 methyl-accepting chemotaxis protein [Pseudoglutamicibacter albus]
MHYSIVHSGASKTVKATQESAQDLDDALKDVKSALDDLGNVLKHSNAVAGAVTAVKDGAVTPAADTVMSKVRTATGSTSDALDSYAQGDETMSSNAGSAPGSPDMPGVG